MGAEMMSNSTNLYPDTDACCSTVNDLLGVIRSSNDCLTLHGKPHSARCLTRNMHLTM